MSSSNNLGLVTFKIIVDGKEISDLTPVLSIQISKYENEISNANISIIDGDPAIESFQIANSNAFELGSEIEIKLGYDSKNQTCFKGIISGQMIESDPEIEPNLFVLCESKESEITKPSTSSVFNFAYEENVNNFIISRELDSSTNKITESGDLSVQGTAIVNPGDTVSISGFGNKFSGDFKARYIFHTMENGIWNTTVTV